MKWHIWNLPKTYKTVSRIYYGTFNLGFNESFKNVIVPDELKSAIVHPMHKGDSSMTYANMRTISTLPILYLFLKNWYIKDRLIMKIGMNYYSKGNSAEHAISDLCKNVVEAIDKRKKTCVIFLDFGKKFDTDNQKILSKKLEYHDVGGVLLIWFESYLFQCTTGQCTKINQSTSDSKKITCGAP